MANDNLTTVLAYYEAINQQQIELAAEKLTDNIKLISPLDERSGKENVLPALEGFSKAIEGVSITAKLSEGSQVMLAYDILFPEPVGKLRAAGLLTLKNGLIAEIELFYDGRRVQAKKDEIFS